MPKEMFSLKKPRPLATLIAVTIVLLVILSTLTISVVLYLNLGKSLTIEFEERVRAEGREVSQALTNRSRRLETRLKALTLDNTVRVTLMLGARMQLEEHLRAVYRSDSDIHFFIEDTSQKYSYSVSQTPFEQHEMWQALSSPPASLVLTNDLSHLGFKLTYTLPITRQQDDIGLASALYLFKDDNYLKSILGSGNAHKLVIISNGAVWDLLSGELLSVPETFLFSEDDSAKVNYLQVKNADYAAVVVSNQFNLFLFSNISNLENAQKKVLYSVMFPALGVIVLSLFVSFYLSKRLIHPLRQLTDMALAITNGETAIEGVSENYRILEFNRLRMSLSSMLSHLEHLRELERYQELFEGVGDNVFIHNLSGEIIDVNEVAITSLGVEREKLRGINITNFVPEHLKVQLNTHFSQLNSDSQEIVFSTEFIKSSGEVFFVECHAKRILYMGGDVVLNVVRDISDRMIAQNALKESHETLLTILDSIQATIHVCDLENCSVLFMNKYMRNLFGIDLVGKRCSDVSPFLEGPCKHCYKTGISNNQQDVIQFPPWEGQHQHSKKWFMHYDRFITWVDGRSAKFQIAFDISDLKELTIKKEEAEAQLVKIQKMEAIGTLAGGVAHDLNNILSGIVSFPDMLLRQIPEDSPLQGPLMTIKKSGLKASETVGDLLTLARRGVIVNQVVNLNEVISDYLESPEYRRFINAHQNVDIEVNLQPNLLGILGSTIHLSKTVMNLVTNAAEAIQGSGTVFLNTSVEIIEELLAANPSIPEGEYVVLRVRDDGIGISPKDCDRIFEPFFTTKVMGRSGTGLGMAVVWGTVVDHDGYIHIDSNPGQGTTFKIYFPVTRTEYLKKQAVLSDKDFQGNGETVLIIDDIKEQREIGVLMFSQLGYKPKAVSSGEEAVQFLTTNKVDLVILDMIMEGGMDGLDTYKEILKIHPEQKAIVTTGYSKTSQVTEVLDLGAGQYVKKPFLYEEIAQAVWSELHNDDSSIMRS